jgi:hypothetical protein
VHVGIRDAALRHPPRERRLDDIDRGQLEDVHGHRVDPVELANGVCRDHLLAGHPLVRTGVGEDHIQCHPERPRVLGSDDLCKVAERDAISHGSPH